MNTDNHISTEVCILGGGPAGLGAAFELSAKGVEDIILVDRNERLGGLARTINFEGNLFDIGPHRFFTKNAEVNAIWHDVLGSDFIPVQRLTRIFYKNKFFHYPLKVDDVLLKLGLNNASTALLSYLAAQVRSKRDVLSFEDWVVSKFGQKLYETFFKTYTEKVWGIPCREIGAEWAQQRIKGLDLKNLLSNSLGLGGAKKLKTLVDEFDYPRQGAGMMYESMWGKVESSGRTLMRSSTVVRVNRNGSSIVSIDVENERGEKVQIAAKHYFVSAAMTRFFQMFEPAVPQSVANAAESLYYRDHITVNLVVSGEDLFPDQWIYVHSPDVKMARLANYNNFSRAMRAEKGTTLLSVEYFVFRTDAIWALSDYDLIELACDELSFMGLVAEDRMLRARVVREVDSYPTYYLGYEGPFGILKSFGSEIQNCSLIGRGGMYKYNNMDHSLYTGLLAARNYKSQGRQYDVWAVNIDAEYHEAAQREASTSSSPTDNP